MPSPAIVFLDRSTMDRGDIDFTPLDALGEFQAFPYTAPDEVAGRIRGAEVVLTNKVVLDRKVIAQAPALKLICVCATGVNNVDLEAAREHGVIVCNVSGYSTPSVTQHTMGLLINLATNIHRYGSEPGKWCESPMFSRLDYPVIDLAGKTLGIAGAGSIGTAVGNAAAALGMGIQLLGRDGHRDATPEGWPRLDRHRFFESSDAVTLHCPLTPETRHLINAQTLALMPEGALLVNTGRGDLVDESALAAALMSGRLGGAALDVLSVEPPPLDHPLLDRAVPNLLITPHSAWTSRDARRRLLDGVVKNVESFLAGNPVNCV